MIEPNEEHFFDPKIAELYGINAALLFRYICWRSDHSKNRWVALTLPDLCARYPYLGRDQCYRALAALTHPGKKTPALISRKAAPAGCGFIYAPVSKDNTVSGLHTFNVLVATEVGIVAAIIHHNITYWIKLNWRERVDELSAHLDPKKFDYDNYAMEAFAYVNTEKAAKHTGSVEKWAEAHSYISLRTVERGFARLVKHRMLSRTYNLHRVPVWGIPARTMCKLRSKWLNAGTLDYASAKTKFSAPKSNADRQYQTDNAKTKQEHDLSCCEQEVYEALRSPLKAHSRNPFIEQSRGSVPEHPCNAEISRLRRSPKFAVHASDEREESDQQEVDESYDRTFKNDPDVTGVSDQVASDVAVAAELEAQSWRKEKDRYKRTIKQTLSHLNIHNDPVVKKSMKTFFGNHVPRRRLAMNPENMDLMDELPPEDWRALQQKANASQT